MGSLRSFQGLQGTIGQPTAQVCGGSLKFKGGQYLERTSTAGNQTTWTWSGWIKTSDLSGNNIFGEDGGYPNASASFNTSGQLRFTAAAADSSVFLNIIPSALFRDLSAWYHFVIIYDSGNAVSSERARVYVNGKRITDLSTATYPSQSATTVVNSNGNAFRIGSHSGVDHLQGYMSQCYFIDGLVLGPGYFGFTDPLTNTWRPRKFRAEGTTVNDGTQWSSYMSNSTGAANLFDGSLSTAYGPDGNTQTFTPPNPIIVKNSLRIYYSSGVSSRNFEVNDNGNVVATGTGTKWVDLNFTGPLTKISGSAGWNVYAIEVDGVIMQDSTTTNLSFGTNGFYLPMDDEDRFRLDQSGKNNHFTEAGWSGTSVDPDVVKDSPSGAVFGGRAQTGITTTSSAPANYCTLNPIDKESNVVLSNGNLDGTASGGDGNYRGTIPMKTGKFYWEITQVSGGNYSTYGIIRSTLPVSTLNTDTITYRNDGFTKKDGVDGSSFNSISGSDVLGVACDCDNNQISYYKNNTLQTTITFTTEMADDGVSAYGRWNNGKSADYNFGQKPFKYAPPQGFLPLNSATVRPNTVVPRPDQYVGVTTYNGQSSSFRLRSGFSPDLAFIKSRTNTTTTVVFDTVRGLGNYFQLTETDQSYSGGITQTFNDGFLVPPPGGAANNASHTYVAYTFKAGGNKNTFNVDGVGYASAAAAGLTAGNITPTGASVGTKQGFSIIGYTGDGQTDGEVPHGLNQSPDFIIVKSRSVAKDWKVHAPGLTSQYLLTLNENYAPGQSSWDGVTDTVFKPARSGDTYLNTNAQTFMAYCWHNVPGLQKFGSFTGNGDTNDDGPFIELGFRPAIILFKRAEDAGYNWNIYDTRRSYGGNPTNEVIRLNLTNVEEANYGNGDIDVLANGVKIRNYWANINQNGKPYVYAAWATAPASNLFGGQSNAR